MARKRRSAFSIVELLIIVAIIGVLAIMLTPAVGAAWKLSQRTICMNNERALLMATQQYVINDTEGRLPFPNYGGTVQGGPGKEWDCPAFPGWLYTWPHYGTTPDDMKTGTLWKFVADERTYHCPREDTQDAVVSSFPQPSINITSYTVNYAVYGDGVKSRGPSPALTDFRQPTATVFMFECAPYGQSVSTGAIVSSVPARYFNGGANRPNQNNISDRHGAGAPVGFLDWHVEYYDLGTYQLQLSQTPGPLWCSPYSTSGQ